MYFDTHSLTCELERFQVNLGTALDVVPHENRWNLRLSYDWVLYSVCNAERNSSKRPLKISLDRGTRDQPLAVSVFASRKHPWRAIHEDPQTHKEKLEVPRPNRQTKCLYSLQQKIQPHIALHPHNAGR